MSSISPFVTNWFKILKSATPFLPPAIVPEGNWAKSQLNNSRSKLNCWHCVKNHGGCVCICYYVSRDVVEVSQIKNCWLIVDEEWGCRSLPTCVCLPPHGWVAPRIKPGGEPNRTPCTLRLTWKGQGENIKKILTFLFPGHIYECSPSMWNSHKNLQIFSIIFLHNWPLVKITVCPNKSSR